jgi:hypothetical protein
MESLDSDEEKYSDQDLKMLDWGLDPKMVKDCGLDPKKTMDFALFQDVCFQFLFPEENHESLARFVRRMQSGDIKRPPPLSVIRYDGRRNFYAFLFCLRSRLAIYLRSRLAICRS